MKQLQTVFLIAVTLFSTTPLHAQEATEKAEILDLIKTLARLTDMADACGEHMNYFGKKALEGEVCKEFNQAYHDQWPTRAALQQQVSDYTVRLQKGDYTCDTCEVMLQRVEELRITVTYYLDYMDFVKTF
ncbi:hypothetical protein Tel_07980 [Candidatus Tenderia electrophaga]|jgi:hypothetical protein|uniref:Uncharacterized protein n=1 Tax=Candidatus Tenderia electrophaga TaxID=1748243 RepID=A0A0S2TD67_9GAMM|nr:hypothetical protein Tel_07980 [Candidatus Tenderia electrophaga]